MKELKESNKSWIHINKRLPKWNEHVIVQNSDGAVFMARLFNTLTNQEGTINQWYEHDSSRLINNIVFWQPKPEAYSV